MILIKVSVHLSIGETSIGTLMDNMAHWLHCKSYNLHKFNEDSVVDKIPEDFEQMCVTTANLTGRVVAVEKTYMAKNKSAQIDRSKMGLSPFTSSVIYIDPSDE